MEWKPTIECKGIRGLDCEAYKPSRCKSRAPLLGQFPIDPELAQLCDEGNIERYDSEELNSFAEAFLKAM